MSNFTYEIVTEACANMPKELSNRYDIKYLPMVNLIDGSTEAVNMGFVEPADAKEFYAKMRNKTVIKTSCVSDDSARNILKPILEAGKDVIYMSLSSGLSASFSVVANTVEQLKKEYPDRKLFAVDLLAAAMGHALLITHACEMREKGMDIESLAKEMEEKKFKLCHYFTVENLAYLYRGGRLKKSSYLLASALNVKPVMHVDNNGHLVAIGKVFGRKMSINSLVNHTVSKIENPESATIYISHGDCLEDAELYINKVKEKLNIKTFKTEILDLVIGAHSGPGTLAVFFFGKER